MAVTGHVTARPAHRTDEQETAETRDGEADGRDRIVDERDRLGAALDRGNARAERTRA